MINITFVCGSDFEKKRKSKTGFFAPSPSKADAKLKETYEAVNRRLVSALVDNNFQDLIEACPRGCCC